MEYQALLGGMFPAVASNQTVAADNSSDHSHSHSHSYSRTSIMETVLPLVGLGGFAPMYQFVGGWLGWDPSYLLATVGVFWALNKLYWRIYNFLYSLVLDYLTSTIHVSSTDDIYDHMMAWLSKKPEMVNSRSIMAETIWNSMWEEGEDESTMGHDPSGLYLNFSNQEARTRPKYIPAVGLHNFWWKGQYFWLQRKKESLFDEAYGFATFKDKEDLTISCLWRSPEPIKRLLAHAKQQYYSEHQSRTTVKRPYPAKMRQGRHNWQTVASRPVRDMKTVVLDQVQKRQVLADINEYLHPATPRWYSNRGIPLRRGYLFHGPPGTGKTSLSFALAGVFGLDIFVISLLEPTLTEEDLGGLFSSLPRRCIVLLEDIDTAGLRRPSEDADEKTKKKSSSSEEDDEDKKGTATLSVKELAKALKREDKNKRQTEGISLSGLLNAIDGVASHEGRILIMTTNAPESLDDALIRPGRIDMQVQFTNATTEQARELFIRMYEADEMRPSKEGGDLKTITTNGSPNGKSPLTAGVDLDINLDQLPHLARQFSEKIPAGQFSPAEIQGYLLKRKKAPGQAVEEADKWVAAVIEQKANKTKVIKVQ
ncbi:P-loop containing nucleoside triphosphate hydrolase protein [Poronia punctata]|nr:P-loop containing nucleoside triphosphate hydrolase protein [Poronia punctata]